MLALPLDSTLKSTSALSSLNTAPPLAVTTPPKVDVPALSITKPVDDEAFLNVCEYALYTELLPALLNSHVFAPVVVIVSEEAAVLAKVSTPAAVDPLAPIVVAVIPALKVAAPAADISRVRAVTSEPPSLPINFISLSETLH